MTRQIINIGTFDNDPNADNLREGGGKINDNFEELYDLANNRGIWRQFGLLPGNGPATAEDVANKINTAGIVLPVSPTSTPVLIEVSKFNSEVNYNYIFIFLSGKGSWGGPETPVNANSFRRISISRVSPEDIEDNLNAIINNIDPVVDGDFISKANELIWNFGDSGQQQEDGGIKSYYFTYTKDGVLYFALFNGVPGIYGGTETPFTEDMFVITTNSNITPEKTKLSEFENDVPYAELIKVVLKLGQASQSIEGNILLTTGNLNIQGVDIKSTVTPLIPGISGPDLFIGPTPNTSRTSRFYINEPMSIDNQGGHAFGDYTPITNVSTLTNGAYAGFDARPELGGAGAWNHCVAFQARPVFIGSGDMANFFAAFEGVLVHTGSGNITNGAVIRINSFQGAGTYTNRYGLYIENMPTGPNDYAIYTNNGKVRFGGKVTAASDIEAGANVLIGTTSNPNNARFRLYGIAEFDSAAATLLRFMLNGVGFGYVGMGNFATPGGTSSALGVGAVNDLQFGAGNAYKASIKSATGNMTIGYLPAVDTGEKLQANGEIKASPGTKPTSVVVGSQMDSALTIAANNLANNYIPKAGAVTKTGTLTLSDSPIVPVATLSGHAVNKQQLDAKVSQSITNGVTTSAPSEDAMFDALALKANASYKVYTAFITQGGTTAPSIVWDYENTIGSITFNRTGVGAYTVTSSGLFTSTKTFFSFQISGFTSGHSFTTSFVILNPNLISYVTLDNGVLSDEIGDGILEIRVYN